MYSRPLGTLPLPFSRGRFFSVMGGPYPARPKGYLGVKMAAEIQLPCLIDIPTRDFQTPDQQAVTSGLIFAINCILQGKPLYVGCKGGMGRTGLFLALLAKAFGVRRPVEYVREHYYSHAVETSEQYAFVRDFVIPREVRRAMFLAKIKYFLVSRENLTRLPELV